MRAWQASGKSLSEFSRGKEFTASGLSYRRAGGAGTLPGASPLSLRSFFRGWVVLATEPKLPVSE